MDKAAANREQPEIRDLTRRLAAGDEDSFRIFHAAYFGRLLRYLFVMTRGDEEAAREALQDTMTRVVRYARPFDSEQVFWSWLTIIARSAVIDGSRKKQRYWKLLRGYALWWKPALDDGIQPQETEEYLQRLLLEALQDLEPLERTLVQRKYLEGGATREIALEVGLTERAVESRLLRARRQLRETLLRRMNDDKAV